MLFGHLAVSVLQHRYLKVDLAAVVVAGAALVGAFLLLSLPSLLVTVVVGALALQIPLAPSPVALIGPPTEQIAFDLAALLGFALVIFYLVGRKMDWRQK